MTQNADPDERGSSRLRERTILVTGAAGGIGAEQARMFAQHGADVVLADIDADRAADVARSIGASAYSCPLDVREEAGWEEAVRMGAEQFGRPITGMVNNAAVGGRPAPMVDTTLEKYLRVVNTDQVGTFLGLKVCGRHMLDAQARGSMVTISSVLGIAGHRNISPYVSAKFAVRGLTRTAALEFAASGIRVNCICPGTVNTVMLRGPGDSHGGLSRLAEQVPQGAVAEPAEIALAAIYLLSDDSRYVSGTDLVVDGAMTAAIPFDLLA